MLIPFSEPAIGTGTEDDDDVFDELERITNSHELSKSI